MINEQIQTILNKLGKLGKENLDIEQFISSCEGNPAPISVIVSCLLDTIREKDEQIQSQNQTITNYQVKTEGIYSRLNRRPRRLSLRDEENKGIELIPGTPSPYGSLATYYNKPFTRKRFSSLPTSQVSSPVPFDYSSLSSPRSVHSPVGNLDPNLNIPELDQVLEVVAQEEAITVAQEEELNNLRQQTSLLQSQLEQRDKTILNLETERQKRIQQQETADNKIKELQSQASQLQTEIKKQAKRINSLEGEVKETNNDYYQLGQQKDRLATLLQNEKANNKRLEEQLAREVNENQCLKETQNITNKKLFDKLKELRQTKKLANEEKIALQKIINDQTKKYREESQERELEHRKKMENLMKLQSNDYNNKKNPTLRRLHSASVSLPVSRSETPRGSFYYDEENSAGPSLNSPTLWFEIKSSEVKNNADNRRKGSSSSFEEITDKIGQSFQEMLELVDNNVSNSLDEPTEREKALLKEIEQLSDNHLHLERAWKDLKDAYDALEKSSAELRSQQLIGENERQKLQEEIDGLKYQLAEAQTHKFRLEKEVKDKNKMDESTAKLVAERDKLKKELTTLQNKLDGMYSENAKLVTQKLTEVNRAYDRVRVAEAQLQKEREDNQNTKIHNQKLLNEIARLKKNNDLIRIGNSINKLGSATERAKSVLDLLRSQIEVDINKK